MNEIKGNIKRWRDILCSWVERINVVKTTIVSNVIYRVNTIPIILPMALFTEVNKESQNSYGNIETPNSQSNLEKEECS